MIRSRLKYLGIAFVPALLGVIVTLAPGTLELEQNIGLDWLFRLRGTQQQPIEVAVVSLDSASAAAMGFHRDPDRWPRSLHAELIDRLSGAGAALIVFDLSFDAPRDAAQDRALAAAVRRAGNVLLLERLDGRTVAVDQAGPALRIERRVPPIALLEQAALATAPFPLPVVPVKVSQFWAFDTSHGGVPTLPVLAFIAFARDSYDELLELIRPHHADAIEAVMTAGDLALEATALRVLFREDPGLAGTLRAVLADDSTNARGNGRAADNAALPALIDLFGGRDSRYLDYYGPARTIATIPYHEIVRETTGTAAIDLGNRVVFVGFSERSALDQQDTFYTPFSESSGANLSGVEIGATAFANLMQRRVVEPLSVPASLLVVTVWGTAVAALLMGLPVWAGLPTAVLIGAAYVALAYGRFDAAGLWLPLVVPLLVQLPAAALVAVAWRYRQARAYGEHARRTLRYYLPSWVTDDADRNADGVGAAPKLLHGTCLVTDAEQYTALSERMPPQELHRFLNDYYAVLFREVERYGGFVADVVGDSMVAVWASPNLDPAQREAACNASLAVLASAESFNAGSRRWQLPTRLGLHAGRVLLGDVGAESHFEYRAVGDIVNTASRIQGLNKRLGTRLLVSTEALQDTIHLVARPVGSFLLVGKEQPLEIHELLGSDDSITAVEAELAEMFAAALMLFRARDWARAARAFASVLERCGSDGPSRYYLERCRELAAAEPGQDWDGTIVVTQK